MSRWVTPQASVDLLDRPVECESIYGWLARRSISGQVGWSDLGLKDYVGAGRLFTLDWRRPTAAFSGFRAQGFNQAKWRRLRCEALASCIDGVALLIDDLRYCRQCADLRFHARIFQHVSVGDCPIHQTPLSETCWSCSRRIPATLKSALDHPFECPFCLCELGSKTVGGRQWKLVDVDLHIAALTDLLEGAARSAGPVRWTRFARSVPMHLSRQWGRYAAFRLNLGIGSPFIDFRRKEVVIALPGAMRESTDYQAVNIEKTAKALAFLFNACGPEVLNELCESLGRQNGDSPEYWEWRSVLARTMSLFLHWTGVLGPFDRLWQSDPRAALDFQFLARSAHRNSLMPWTGTLEEAAAREHELLGYFSAILVKVRRSAQRKAPENMRVPPASVQFCAFVRVGPKPGQLTVRYRVNRALVLRLIARYAKEQTLDLVELPSPQNR